MEIFLEQHNLVDGQILVSLIALLIAAWLAQLVWHQTAETEVVGSNPGQTNQVLKITGKIMLAVHLQTCLSSGDRAIRR